MPSVADVLARHVSCRDYLDRPIPDALLEDLLRAAQQSATDATGQLYSVVRLRDPDLRRNVARLAGDQAHLMTASEFLIVLLDAHRLARILESRGETYGMQTLVALLFGITDATIFAQSLVAAAEGEGLGTCYIGGVQNQSREIARALELPDGVLPLYGITLGWPREAQEPRPRLPVATILHTDRYRPIDAANSALAFEVMAKATRSGDWLNPIRKYFAQGGVMAQREEELRALLAQQGFPLSDSSGTPHQTFKRAKK